MEGAEAQETTAERTWQEGCGAREMGVWIAGAERGHMNPPPIFFLLQLLELDHVENNTVGGS